MVGLRCPGCGVTFDVLESILEGREGVECPLCFSLISCAEGCVRIDPRVEERHRGAAETDRYRRTA